MHTILVLAGIAFLYQTFIAEPREQAAAQAQAHADDLVQGIAAAAADEAERIEDLKSEIEDLKLQIEMSKE